MSFYRFVRALAVGYSKLFHRMTVIGKENMPVDGGCIVIANHSSFLDPVLAASAIKRDVYFMAKSDLLENKFMEMILKACNVVPVHRGESDIAAMRKTCEIVDNGNIAGIFPQGTRIRCQTLDVNTVQAGIGLIGARTKAPVVPVSICYGKKNNCPRFLRKVTVVIGSPMSYEEYALENGERKTSQEIAKYAFTKVCEQFADYNHG